MQTSSTNRTHLHFITTQEELSELLNASPEWEAALRKVEVADVILERQKWLDGSKTDAAFLKRWRHLNAISFQAYSRLSGISVSTLNKALKNSACPVVFEPITGKCWLSLRAAFYEGYTFDEIERARNGEHVHLMRELFDHLQRCGEFNVTR